MKTEGVAVKYGDFALGAKENFAPSASEKEPFINLEQLQQNNLDFPRYVNPCELYQTVLDGSGQKLPEDMEGLNLGYWSSQVTRNDKTFETPVVVSFTANGQYSSVGFSLSFDREGNVYPTHMNITWQRNGEDIETEDFYPNDAFYFAEKRVDNFDKVVMTFYSLNMPKNRLKLHVVDWGYGTYFYGNELRNINVTQEIDPASTQIAINPCTLTIESKRTINYSFQAKQPLSIYYNGELISTNFVKKANRKAERMWEVQTDDYIGIMESSTFFGDMYTDKNVGKLLAEIFNAAHVPFTIDEEIANMTVSGHIPYTNCRKALMQVAFAVQAVVDTSNSDVVKVFKLSDEIKQEIPLSRIKQGQNFDNGEVVTSVELTVHKYIKPSKEEYEDAYDGGSGENIVVIFPAPLYDVTISRGEILELSANHAIINAQSSCTVTGKLYKEKTSIISKRNDVLLTTDIENKVSIKNATLITSANAQYVLDTCFDWLIKADSVKLDIVEGKHVTGGNYVLYGGGIKYGGGLKYNGKTPKIVTHDKPVFVGDKLTCNTEYLGKITGRLIKQQFSLNGNILVKKAVLK